MNLPRISPKSYVLSHNLYLWLICAVFVPVTSITVCILDDLLGKNSECQNLPNVILNDCLISKYGLNKLLGLHYLLLFAFICVVTCVLLDITLKHIVKCCNQVKWKLDLLLGYQRTAIIVISILLLIAELIKFYVDNFNLYTTHMSIESYLGYLPMFYIYYLVIGILTVVLVNEVLRAVFEIGLAIRFIKTRKN